MKKYIGFLLCVSAALFAASCGEKQSLEVDNTPKMKVVSHDVVFQPDGGTGSITVECESAITAEVQTTNSAGEKWCTATVDGKKINVTVGKYSGVESRYSNIIIKGADETLNVAVHQYGIIMNEFDADDAIIKNPAQTLSYAYKANALMQASSSVDWITVSTTDNKLEVKVAENTSKEYRQGTVEWNVGMLKGSFVLTQFDAADAGLLGEWTWNCKQVTTNRAYELNAVLSEDENGYTLKLTKEGAADFSMPVLLDGKVLSMPLGVAVGTYTTSSGTKYPYTFPMIVNKTTAIVFDAAVAASGYYNFNLAKDEAGVWVATADHSAYTSKQYLAFEAWSSAEHEGNSNGRLVFSGISMTKK